MKVLAVLCMLVADVLYITMPLAVWVATPGLWIMVGAVLVFLTGFTLARLGEEG